MASPGIKIRDLNESGSYPEKNRSRASASDNYKPIGPKAYSYDELANATDHFSLNNQIGQGGFGQIFKASLNGKIRAIKKLNNFADVHSGDLEKEIKVVNRVSHKNLVKLVGYCIDGANRLLILKYFSNGSLRSKLHGRENILDWKKRMNIAIGSARGLEYLHEYCKPKIIHVDIKADNILLDHDFEPKISDFGLALFFSEAASHVSKSSIRGTQIYADPWTTQLGKHSDKSDVYSFGIMLLELITGRKPIDHEGISIVIWANPLIEKALGGEYSEFVDSRLQSFDYKEMYRMIFCANTCINQLPKSRPSIKMVLLALEGTLALKELCNEENDNKLGSEVSYTDEPKPSTKPPIIQETNHNAARKGRHASRRPTEATSVQETSFDERNQVYKARRFTYQQLSSATKDFSEDNLIYQGILGEVYMESLNGVGQVIIKKFYPEKEDEFKKIKDISSSVDHKNLINLVGYCDEGYNKLLVYECFRFRSSLRFCLFGRTMMSTMDWPTRMRISLSIAKGLVHLHELYKPLNIYEYFLDDYIFLDDNLEPKFAEYERAKFFLRDSEMPISTSSTISAYIKLDVYFFGIILLKIITGNEQHKYISSINDFNLIELMAIYLKNNWPESDYCFVDPRIMSYDKYEMNRMVECALACVNRHPKYRPSMSEVVEVLAGNIPARNLEN